MLRFTGAFECVSDPGDSNGIQYSTSLMITAASGLPIEGEDSTRFFGQYRQPSTRARAEDRLDARNQE